MYIYVCVYIYIYTCIYIYTHTHTKRTLHRLLRLYWRRWCRCVIEAPSDLSTLLTASSSSIAFLFARRWICVYIKSCNMWFVRVLKPATCVVVSRTGFVYAYMYTYTILHIIYVYAYRISAYTLVTNVHTCILIAMFVGNSSASSRRVTRVCVTRMMNHVTYNVSCNTLLNSALCIKSTLVCVRVCVCVCVCACVHVCACADLHNARNRLAWRRTCMSHVTWCTPADA